MVMAQGEPPAAQASLPTAGSVVLAGGLAQGDAVLPRASMTLPRLVWVDPYNPGAVPFILDDASEGGVVLL